MNRTLAVFVVVSGIVGLSLSQTMTPHYDSYVSYSTDSSNNTLQTIVVEGYTSGSCSTTYVCGPNNQMCTRTDSSCANAYHYGKTNNVLGGVGGWTTGPSVNPFAYMTFQTTTTLYIAPGDQAPATWEGDAVCSVLGNIGNGTGNGPISGFSPIQHNYPRNPLAKACFISSFFDAVRGLNKIHKANDVILDDGTHKAGIVPAYGEPVYAMEEGDVVAAPSTNGPASAPFDTCKSWATSAPGNYVKIKATSDHYFTIYFHVAPSVAVGKHVFAGDQIGVLDNSGCQKNPHLHVQRKDPSGKSVNATIPCANPTPIKRFFDDLVDDDVPDDI